MKRSIEEEEMKVFAVKVFGCDDCGGDFIATIFSSEEEAEKAAKDYTLTYGHFATVQKFNVVDKWIEGKLAHQY